MKTANLQARKETQPRKKNILHSEASLLRECQPSDQGNRSKGSADGKSGTSKPCVGLRKCYTELMLLARTWFAHG